MRPVEQAELKRPVLVFSTMFSVTTMLNSKRANKRARQMRAYAGAEMNT